MPHIAFNWKLTTVGSFFQLQICMFIVYAWFYLLLQCQYAFIYQSLSDYLRLRSCCCWKQTYPSNSEDCLFIGSPSIDSTNCWSDVILNRSSTANLSPESLQLPSVHYLNQQNLWTSDLRSCRQRLETPDNVSFVSPTQYRCLERRKLKRRRFKNKVKPVFIERGECVADIQNDESLDKETDNRKQSDEFQFKRNLGVMLDAGGEETAVGVCAGDEPDAAPSSSSSQMERTVVVDKAEEESCVDSGMMGVRSKRSDDCSSDVIVFSNPRDTQSKESDSSCPPPQLSEHILNPICCMHSLIYI